MAGRITLDALNGMAGADFVDALDGIFEHTPWVAQQAEAGRPYPTVAALHAGLMAAVLRASTAERVAFVVAHPDLAGKAARAGAIADASIREQAGLGLDRLSDDEFARFEELNRRYRHTFGIPFVICVNRQTRDAVLDAFARRLHNGRDAELATALAEIGHITRLRLVERIAGPGAPIVHGRLTTHVLDTCHGRAAAGVAIELFELGRSGPVRRAGATTNADGRTDSPLLAGAPLRIGRYELCFGVGEYFEAAGAELPKPPFLDVVVIRFSIAEPEGHVHVPLVVTPWSYATYRGS